MAYILTLVVLIGISVSLRVGVSGTKLETLQCTNSQLQRCLISVTFERRTTDVTISTIDLMKHCRSIREGLNCLVWYSVNCVSQSQRPLSEKVIGNVREYLKNTCEDFEQVDENWLDGSCFLRNEVETCKDNYFKHNTDFAHQTFNENNCAQYSKFKKCVKQTLDEICSEDNKLFSTTYLLDKGGQLSWLCSEEDIYINVKNDQAFQRSIKGAQCLISYQYKLSECRKSYEERDYFVESDDYFASACCAFNKYFACVNEVVSLHCGVDSRELTDIALSQLSRDLNKKCSTYSIDMCSSSSAISPLLILIIGLTIVAEVWKKME